MPLQMLAIIKMLLTHVTLELFNFIVYYIGVGFQMAFAGITLLALWTLKRFNFDRTFSVSILFDLC